ncbi:glycosyltransferase [Sporolactobacillus sp. THM7-7]|nr:glycosyltransferase [Sporolactobacillus sp. THM7-7]
MDKVSVILATYNPNKKFLYKLMKSLNEQDYGNYDVIIMDDHSNADKRSMIDKVLKQCLTSVNYIIIDNKTNQGSNKTFENLTKIASSKYIAYCDQDDVWEKDKISTLVKCFNNEQVVAAYSDLRVIDKNDKILSQSFKHYMKRLKHRSGFKLYRYFLRTNSVTGCAMLIRTDIAKQSLPFPNSKIYVHDHWLALYASCIGKISYVERPLINYRIHSENQIGEKVFDGINNKSDYNKIRLCREKNKIEQVKSRQLNLLDGGIKNEILQYEDFVNTRANYIKHPLSLYFIKMIRLLRKDPVLITFELVLGMTPNFCSNLLFKFVKNK